MDGYRNMKTLVVVVVSFLLVSFTAQTTLKTLNDTKFSLKYPSTWEAMRDTGLIDYYIYPPEDTDPSFNENMVVRHTNLAGNKTTLAEYEKMTKLGIREKFPD